MVFKRKPSFFLDLSGDQTSRQSAQPVQVAVQQEKPAAAAAATPAAKSTPAKPEASPAAPSSEPAQPVLTTAEAIAAELRAAQEARPAPSQATFAPECLNPANALPRARRRAGANLAGFKAMGDSLFRS
ncbi:hypothetical protein [Synechococcus sp. GFB01]|uniref:hypothetical protein n=1 Tax=Synechococcus sp. GFB01 TaxID=1662190 RepID=UPI00064FBDF9|nr:hypothetical protein [Synechococcus sp. GFB01]KMM16371.1 hypothetical protein SYNGFB01_11515 [Synechococcus sp. GFB01]